MLYVALLRGINVGGKAIIAMAKLKLTFEHMGLERVQTYINSGNVIFSSEQGKETLTARLEAAIGKEFGTPVKVLLKTHAELTQLVHAIPADWVNGNGLKCDVLFLWPDIDEPDIIERIPYTPGIDDIRYVPGAVLRRVEQAKAGKSRLTRLVGTPLYQRITIRNTNTARKLLGLMDERA